MKSIRATLKKSFILLMVAVQTLGYSAGLSRIALADETTAAATEAVVSPAPCPEVSGTDSPTGSAGHTFIFNEESCIWENDYYTWNPQTKVTTPKYSLTPVYNSATDAWEHTEWNYSPAADAYRPVLISVPANTPSQQTSPTSPTAASSPSGTAATTDATGNGALAQSSGSSTITAGNGTGSANSITNGSDTTANIGLTNNAAVLTTLGSTATSGDALLMRNTTVGDAATGDATTMANILNMIQSSWNPANGDINLFSADLYNNYFGDLLFDPSIILGNGTGSANNIASDSNQNLTINVAENADITNNINLDAQSGNADVSANTTVGNVSTGDATAVANVINMINSMITSGRSFIGSINLHGSLNGDILLPSSLMELMLGNGTGASNTIANNQNTDINANSTTNSSITNNTDLSASSGNAVADANTTVGNLTTGNAETNVNEMNLVGQNVQGSKGLLVFVNVLGKWVGMLFSSPGNTSIAAGNGSNSTNNITGNNTTDANLNVTQDYGITNNLNLNAASGDATASRNTTVGNVSTGNASSSVNLLNMINSKMNFTDWFGVLFINVFGSWTGSFGNDTAAGETEQNKGSAGLPPNSQTVAGAATTQGGESLARVIKKRIAGVSLGSGSSSSDDPTSVAGTATTTPPASDEQASSSAQTSTQDTSHATTPAIDARNIWLPITFGVIAIALLFGQRLLALVRRV